MQVGSSSASRLKRNSVYGLPTFWGLLMFALVGGALWFSIFSHSQVDRWIAFLMIILILLHLGESNNPFRSLEFTLLPFEPPFSGDSSLVTFEVTNSTELPSEELHFRLKGAREWTTLFSLSAKSTRQIQVALSALSPGPHSFPRLHVKTRPVTQLFQLWKVMRPKVEFYVLPRALDHGVQILKSRPAIDDLELSHIESILDERLLYKMDHKLFLKTGKAYYRATETKQIESFIRLEWTELEHLASDQRAEQFSSWLQQLRSQPPNARIEVTTPFVQTSGNHSTAFLHSIKEKFADWLYASS